MLAPRAAVAFSRRDAAIVRGKARNRLEFRERDVRALVSVLPLDGADAAARLGRATRGGYRRARDLGARLRPRRDPRQHRGGSRAATQRARGRGGGARDGVAPLAPLDRPPPLLEPERRESGCAPRRPLRRRAPRRRVARRKGRDPADGPRRKLRARRPLPRAARPEGRRRLRARPFARHRATSRGRAPDARRARPSDRHVALRVPPGAQGARREHVRRDPGRPGCFRHRPQHAVLREDRLVSRRAVPPRAGFGRTDLPRFRPAGGRRAVSHDRRRGDPRAERARRGGRSRRDRRARAFRRVDGADDPRVSGPVVRLHAFLGRHRVRRALAFAAAAILLPGCAPRRPDTAPTATAADVTPEVLGGVRRLGSSWVAEDRVAGPAGGILVGRFTGAPYDLGFSFGRLTRPWIRSQETHLEQLFTVLIPGGFKRSLIRQLLALRLRRLPDDVPADLLVSISGLADGYERVPPASGWNAYRRMLDLHALHDVSQRFVDAPALAAACTGFLAKGADGSLLLARNFDFEGGDIFDRQKLVSVVAPEGKISYLSVGFSGMLGVASGFNREGIGVALQAIAGGETAVSGTPMTLLLADVLRNEGTFDGAVARLSAAKVFVSDLILLGDARAGRLAVVEKSPSAFAVREFSGASLGATNEAEDPAVRRFARALPPRSTSRKRRARLDVLLERAGGSLDVPSAIAILRDQRGPDGKDLGPGNRNAIDASIASHSVVLDLTHRRAWVASAPHTLGPFVPVDLEAVLASAASPPLRTAEPIPADAWLTDGSYGRYLSAREALASARRLEHDRKKGWLEAAARDAQRAHELAPEFAEAAAKLGELEARRGNRARARQLLDEALARDPGPAPLRTAAERWREACAAGDLSPLPKEPIPTVP